MHEHAVREASREVALLVLVLILDEDLHGLPEVARLVRRRALLHDLQEAVEAILHVLLRHLLEARRRRACPLTVDEGVGRVKLCLLHDVHGVLEIRLGLAREAHDDIRAERHIRQLPANLLHEREVALLRIVTVHALEDRAGAGLQRQVDVSLDVRVRLHHLDELIREILRVRSHIADTPESRELCHSGEQLREARAARDVIAIGIDILTEQGDLETAIRDQLLALTQDRRRIPRLLASTHIRHDAVGAEIIAAVADVHRALEAVTPVTRQLLDDHLRIVEHLEGALSGHERLVQKLRELVNVMRTENETHVRITLPYPLDLVLLLHHAAGDADDHPVPSLVLMLQTTDPTVELHVRILPHRAGREQHHIRIPVILRHGVAAALQNTEQLLAILRRHLTAHHLDHTVRRIALLLLHLHELTDTVHEIVLPRRLLRRSLLHDFPIIYNVIHKIKSTFCMY